MVESQIETRMASVVLFNENGSLSSFQNIDAADIDSNYFWTNCAVNYARCPLCINFIEILTKQFQLNRTVNKIESVSSIRKTV